MNLNIPLSVPLSSVVKAVAKATARRLRPALHSIEVHLFGLEQSINRLEYRMSVNEERQSAARARLGEVLGLIKAELGSLKGQVQAAIADKDTAIDARVGTDADRLEELVGVAEAILSSDNAEGPAVDVPAVEEPAPGEPAVLPEDSTSGAVSSDDVIAEGVPTEEGGSPDGVASE